MINPVDFYIPIWSDSLYIQYYKWNLITKMVCVLYVRGRIRFSICFCWMCDVVRWWLGTTIGFNPFDWLLPGPVGLSLAIGGRMGRAHGLIPDRRFFPPRPLNYVCWQPSSSRFSPFFLLLSSASGQTPKLCSTWYLLLSRFGGLCV